MSPPIATPFQRKGFPPRMSPENPIKKKGPPKAASNKTV